MIICQTTRKGPLAGIYLRMHPFPGSCWSHGPACSVGTSPLCAGEFCRKIGDLFLSLIIDGEVKLLLSFVLLKLLSYRCLEDDLAAFLQGWWHFPCWIVTWTPVTALGWACCWKKTAQWSQAWPWDVFVQEALELCARRTVRLSCAVWHIFLCYLLTDKVANLVPFSFAVHWPQTDDI